MEHDCIWGKVVLGNQFVNEDKHSAGRHHQRELLITSITPP